MMLHSGELPLRGAARSKEEAASWGSSTAVLRGAAGMGREEAALIWGELPLRGAARLWEGGAGCVWGSSRCAELLDRGREEAAPSGGAPAARSCWDGGGRRLILVISGGAPASARREVYTNSSGNPGTKPEKY